MPGTTPLTAPSRARALTHSSCLRLLQWAIHTTLISTGNIPHLLSLLDYPSVILSVPNFKIDPQWDPMDSNYQPLETNPYDNTNDELVKSQNKPHSSRMLRLTDLLIHR